MAQGDTMPEENEVTTTTRICPICGDPFEEADGFEVVDAGERKLICPDCHDNREECSDCGAVHYDGEMTALEDGDLICNECQTDHYFECADCERITHRDYCNTVGDRTICDSCIDNYSRCADCEDRVRDSDTREVWRDGDRQYVCESCYDDQYVEVAGENLSHHIDNVTCVRHSDGGDTYYTIGESWECEDCHDMIDGDECPPPEDDDGDPIYLCNLCANGGRQVSSSSSTSSVPVCRGMRTDINWSHSSFDGMMTQEAVGSPWSDRLVSFEIETGSTGDSEDFANLYERLTNSTYARHYEQKGDGSLESVDGIQGREYLISRVCGDTIGEAVATFYEAAKRAKVPIENHLAGMHTHVDARDIYKYIWDNRESWVRNWTYFKDHLTIWQSMAAFLVSEWRFKYFYCRGGISYRGDEIPFTGVQPGIMSGSSYPRIAIRRNTVEFRLWPSTSSIVNALARAHFHQVCMDKLRHNLTLTDEERAAYISRIQNAIPHLGVVFARPDEDTVFNMFFMAGINSSYIGPMVRIYKRYNPVNGAFTLAPEKRMALRLKYWNGGDIFERSNPISMDENTIIPLANGRALEVKPDGSTRMAAGFRC